MAGGFVMKKLSNGPFSIFIDQYLQLRRSLGCILQGTEYLEFPEFFLQESANRLK
jgi:hypothetical protein